MAAATVQSSPINGVVTEIRPYEVWREQGVIFGSALDAGFVFSDDPSRPAIFIGDPGHSKADGAVFQVAFDQSFAPNRERIIRGAAGMHWAFGTDLAVGNFLAEDLVANKGGCMEAEDLAVIERGRVRVFRGGDDDRGVFSSDYVTVETPYSSWNWALASDFIQENVHEDLVIGFGPHIGGGGVYLTTALPPGGVADVYSGIWTAPDASGAYFRVRLDWDGSTLSVRWLDDTTISVRDSNGAECYVEYSDPHTTWFGKVLTGYELTPPFNGRLSEIDDISWPPSQSNCATIRGEIHVDDDGDGYSDTTVTVYGLLCYNAVNPQQDEFTLAIDTSRGIFGDLWWDGGCSLEPNPFHFTRIMSCE